MKQLLIFLLSFYTVADSFAQEPTLEWAISIGGTDDEMGNAITTDANGNIYTTGMFEGTVDFDPGPDTLNLTNSGFGGYDLFIQKLDATGKLLWARAILGNAVIGQSISTDTAGNVYVTGTFGYFADFDPGPDTLILQSALHEIFVLKLDSNGSLVWVNNMVSSLLCNNSGQSITIDDNGNIYTTGYFWNSGAFISGSDTFNLTSHGSSDIFVLKMDNNANILWARSMGGSSNDNGSSITTDAEGNVYVTGSFKDTVDFDPGADTLNLISKGSSDIYIQKLDANGDLLWTRSYGSTMPDGGNSISTDVTGNVYVTGSFQDTVDFDPGPGKYDLISNGSADIFIQKLDANGNLLWARSFGSTMIDGGNSISTDASGNAYVTGTFLYTVDFDPGFDTLNLTSNGGSDLFMLKLDSSGSLVWAGSIGGASQEYGNSIITDTSVHIYVTGYYSSTADFDPGADTLNLTPTGGTDLFMLKFSQNTPSPVAILENIQSSINVKPNPTTGTLTIEGAEGTVTVYDIYGRLVPTTNTNTLDISQAATGIYFVRVVDQQGRLYSQKVIKQ